LWSLKNLTLTNPEQAKQILATNPVFSVSILRALFTLGIIDESALQSLLPPNGREQPPMHQNMNSAPNYPSHNAPNYGNAPGYGAPGYSNNPQYGAPPMQYGNQPGYNQAYAAPPPGELTNQQIIQQLEVLPQDQLEQLYAQTRNPLIETILKQRQQQYR